MIYGIGTDIVAVARIALLHQKYGSALARRILSPQELEQCAGCLDEVRFIAKRFAAKEAVAKVLGAPDGLNWQDCEVASSESGQPYLILTGTIAERARTLGINRLHLSLTHDEPVAVAIATAEYLSATELAHLKRFDPESYSMTVLTEDPTD